MRNYGGSRGGTAVINVFDIDRKCELVSQENQCCGQDSKHILPSLCSFTKPTDTAYTVVQFFFFIRTCYCPAGNDSLQLQERKQPNIFPRFKYDEILLIQPCSIITVGHLHWQPIVGTKSEYIVGVSVSDNQIAEN